MIYSTPFYADTKELVTSSVETTYATLDEVTKDMQGLSVVNRARRTLIYDLGGGVHIVYSDYSYT